MTKIDKQITAELTALARTLPRMAELDNQGNQKMRYGTFKEKGKALLASNPGMKDPDGIPLNPDKFYKVKLPCWINHQAEIFKAYKLKGQPGVEIYYTGMLAAFKLWKSRRNSPRWQIQEFIKRIKAAIASNNHGQ